MKTKLFVVLFLTFSFAQAQSTRKAKYIFLFIGDGMGLAQTSLAEYCKQASGMPNYKLQMNTLPVHGFITTHSQSNTITCSAAAGTALACGKKTSNGTISMDSAHHTNYQSVATVAHQRGMRTGIITSVSIDHATPSVFYAHSGSRDDYYDISLQLASSGFDFFAGGAFLDPNGRKSELPQPHINAYDAARKAGYTEIKTVKQFAALQAGANKTLAIDTALWHNVDIPYAIDNKTDALKLADVTQKAIEVLDGDAGFFMMVEGGKIDWACHNNDAATAVAEVYDFDRAVDRALQFARLHPSETLVIVTSDHETGGLALGFVDTKYDSYYAFLAQQRHSYVWLAKHTKQLRDKNAAFEQVYDSLKVWYGFGEKVPMKTNEIEELKTAYTQFVTGDKEAAAAYKDSDPLTHTSLMLLANKSGINWSSLAHSATPVPVRAMGVGQDLFSGYQDNTSVAQHIFDLINK